MNDEDDRRVHVWNRCCACGAQPIVGICYTCQSCPIGPDNDLCSSCHAKVRLGYLRDHHRNGEHTFTSGIGRPAGVYRALCEVPPAEGDAPHVPPGFLVRPEFCCDTTTSFGGYGFVVDDDGAWLLLTALHVLGELCKRLDVCTTASNPSYSGTELPALIRRVRLYDVTEKRWMCHVIGDADEMLVLPDARTGDPEPSSRRDLCAFRIADPGRLTAGTLACRVPTRGDPVWLAARIDEVRRVRKAVVVESTDNSLVFRYDDTDAIPKYVSGAPILDREGHVVGVNVGGGFFDGHRLGHANHVGNLRRHLTQATERGIHRG